MLQHYKKCHPKPKNTDGLKKVVVVCYQLPQDSNHKAILCFRKTHWACVKDGMDIQNMLWEKLFNNIEYWTLQLTVHFFGVSVKYGIKYCKNCSFWTNENTSVKFPGNVVNSFRYKSCNFGKNSVSVVEKSHWSEAFLSHLVYLCRTCHVSHSTAVVADERDNYDNGDGQ